MPRLKLLEIYSERSKTIYIIYLQHINYIYNVITQIFMFSPVFIGYLVLNIKVRTQFISQLRENGHKNSGR